MSVERVIPPETYRFIEALLHNRDSIQREIDDWRLSVRYPENKQVIPGAGYISDPTSNQAIKFADAPHHIKDCEKWVELIDITKEYCRQNQKKNIFDIWYGQERQTVIRAYTRNGVSRLTFKKYRYSAVSFLLFRAIDEGLCSLHNNNKDKNAAI